MNRLARANLLLIAALLGHVLDHSYNQPARHLAPEVEIPGLVGFLAVIVVFQLALRGSSSAALGSVIVGFGNVIGFTAIHLLPHWSAFSDPFSALNLNALSWILLALPMGAGLYVGILGLTEMRGARAPAEAT